mgnify:CR=1 FL=1
MDQHQTKQTKGFDQEAFAESGVPFYVVTTDIETGKPDYIKIDHVFEQMEALRASSALPLVSEIVEYKGKRYWMAVCLIVFPLILWKIWALTTHCRSDAS